MNTQTNSKIQTLLIEDNKGDVRLFLEQVNSDRVDLHIVPTLNEAKIELRGNDYDLILLDLDLPDSAGIETFHEISGELENTPIIVLTGNLDEELGRAVVRLGAQDFLSKNTIDELILNKSIDYAIERFASREVLKRKEQKFRDLIAENPDGVIILNNKNNRILYLNKAGEKLLNIKFDEVLGEEFNVLANESDPTELNIPKPDGGHKVISLNMSGTTWKDIPARIITLRDITELRAKQDRITHLNKLLKTIGEINHLIVSEKDPDILLETACRHLVEGRSYQAAWIGLCGKDGEIENLFQHGLDEEANKFEDYVKNKGELYCYKELFDSVDEIFEITDSSVTCGDCPLSLSKTNIEAIAVKIRNENKNYGIMVATRASNLLGSEEEKSLLKEVASDIGLALHSLEIEQVKKETEKKLIESERFTQSTIDSLSKHIAVIDGNGQILAVNRSWRQFAENNNAEFQKVNEDANYIEVCKLAADQGDETAETILDNIFKVINGEIKEFSVEYPCHSPNKQRWFNLNVSRFAGDGPVRLVMAHINITDLKLASMKITENERKFRSLFNLSPDIIAIQNFDGDILECNDAAIKKLGYKKEQIQSMNISDLQKSLTGENVSIIREKLFQKGNHVFENRLITKDGVEVPVEINASLIDFMGERAIITQSRDIRERKKSEEKVRESEENFRNLFKNATVGIYRSTPEGKILMANPVFLSMLGIESIEELKKDGAIKEFYPDPDARESFKQKLLNEGEAYGIESEMKSKTGEIFYIRESAKLVDIKGEKIFEGVLQDVTEEIEVKRELIVAKNKAEQSDKLKSEFLAQMSHEIRTPLNSMLSGLELVKDDIGDTNEDVQSAFNIIDSSGERIINTIQSILNMSELQTDSYEVLTSNFDFMREIIAVTVDKYKRELKEKDIGLEINAPEENTDVFLDRYSVSQIFNNIFDNAVKYTATGNISLDVTISDSTLHFVVEDTGIGISKEYLGNIFQPFSQETQGYSRPYDGCGLGLALTKKYCELLNGDIAIESKRGEGTKVSITIPLIEESSPI